MVLFLAALGTPYTIILSPEPVSKTASPSQIASTFIGGFRAETLKVYPLSEKPLIASSSPISVANSPIASSSVRSLIAEKAKEAEVPVQLALLIAKVESGFDPLAKSRESSAAGVYQFVKKTFADNCEGEVLNAEDNVSCAIDLLSDRAIGHWTADIRTRRPLLESGFIKCEDFEANKCRANY